MDRYKRHSKSCKRCLRRKQRCHGFPVCTNCEKANATCEQSAFAVQLHRHDDSYTALKRIQTLETQLAQVRAELAEARLGNDRKKANVLANEALPLEETPAPEFASLAAFSEPSQVATLSAGLAQELDVYTDISRHDSDLLSSPSLLAGFQTAAGVHSTFDWPPVPTLEHVVQATVWTKAMPASLSQTLGTGRRESAPAFLRQPNSILPSDKAGQRMVAAYFDKIHTRYPFLVRSEIQQLHTSRHDICPEGSDTCSPGFQAFKLNMVYAIGATILQQTEPSQPAAPSPSVPNSDEPYAPLQPEALYVAALRHASAVRQSPPLQNITAMALLVLYGLRSPSNSGIWHMIGLAMRTCIDLNLHRESSYGHHSSGGGNSDEDESYAQDRLRRRLFWTVYALDRVISLALRRPYTLADADMDTKAPEEGDPGDDTHPIWARFIQIRRLESRIYTAVYGLHEPLAVRYAKVRPLLATLDAWALGRPRLKTEVDNNYFRLLFNKAVLVLLRPFVGTAQLADEGLLARCLQAAGHVCVAFQQMHQRHAYSHSFVSAHSTFNAGITICYCLYRAPQLMSTSVANSLRACSTTMFVMAERSARFRKHRDVLEDIIERVMDSLAQSQVSFGGSKSTHCCRSGPFLAEHDILAVRSLMELSAQQDPSERLAATREPTQKSETSGMEPTLDPQLDAMPVFPWQVSQALWDRSQHSLQMMDEMSLESALC